MSAMCVCASKVEGLGVEGYDAICSVCALEIFVSDSTIRAAEANGLKKEDLLLHCFECAIPKFKHVKNFVPLSEEQKHEITLATWKPGRGYQ